MTATAEQRVESLALATHGISKLQFYGQLARYGRLTISDEYPTAATDGLNVWCNPDFIDGLTDTECMFVYLHELTHIAQRHMELYEDLKERSVTLTNMAMDYEINLKLMCLNAGCDPAFPLVDIPVYKDGPKQGEYMALYDPQFENMSVRQIFEALWEENEEDSPETGGSPEAGEDGGSPEAGEAGDSDDPSEYSQSIQDRMCEGQDSHDWMEVDENDPESQKKMEAVSKIIKTAIQHSAQFAGNSAAELGFKVEDLVEVKTPWYEILRNFMIHNKKDAQYSTFRRFNRRWVGSDMYLPTYESTQVGEMFVAVDRSYSMDATSAEAANHLRVILQDVRPDKVTVLYWGSDIYHVDNYDASNYHEFTLDSIPATAGGTDAACVAEYIKDKVVHGSTFECGIILTDGYVYSQGEWGPLNIPLLWGITKDGDTDFNPEIGQVITLG
jgi:predicted metal-dependent peptidase